MHTEMGNRTCHVQEVPRFFWKVEKKELETVKFLLKLQCLCTKQVIIHLGLHATSISRET